MKFWSVALLFLCSFGNVQSQATYEIGGFYGRSYYLGELNPTGHFKSQFMHQAYGAFFRHAINARWALRYNFSKASLSGDDAFSNDPSAVRRNLSFESELYEGSCLVEFNFVHYHSFVYADFFSPYLTTGLSLFRFNPKASLNGNIYELASVQTEGKSYSRLGVALPFGLGVKFKFTHRVLFALEWGMRKASTDYLDDVSGFYPDPTNMDNVAIGLSNKSVLGSEPAEWGSIRGNPNNRDWYNITSFQVAIRLGKNPRLCHYKPE